MEAVIAQAKSDLASGTVEDLRRKVEEYTALLGIMRRLVPEKNEVPALIDDISTKAQSTRRDHRPDRAPGRRAGPPFDTYRYRLEIIGHYDQLGEFLSDNREPAAHHRPAGRDSQGGGGAGAEAAGRYGWARCSRRSSGSARS